MTSHDHGRAKLTAGVLCLAALWISSAVAGSVGGTITNDTTWATGDSPYVVTNVLTVPDGVRLDIEPGVTVRIGADHSIDVQGTLVALGSALQPIMFTSRTNEPYGGPLRFDGSDFSLGATGTFEHCTFSFLRGQPAMLQTDHTRLAVRHCTFTEVPATVIRPVDSRATIENCTIHDTREGVNFIRSAGTVTSNRIYRLLGDWDAIDLDAYWTGGGDESLTVTGNILHDGYDDAIDINFAPARVTGNIISNFVDKAISLGLGGNSPANRTYGETAVIDNNLFMECDMGVAIKDQSRPLIFNNTIIGCNVGVASYDKLDGPGFGAVSNTVIWNCGQSIQILDGGDVDFGYCAIEGTTVWPGEGNINTDPEFVDAAGHDYRLRTGSPCVDAGSNIAVVASGTDLDGHSRLEGARVDMGAYEQYDGDLQCNLAATNRTGGAPLAVVFNAQVAGTNLSGLTFHWDIGHDGTIDLAGPGRDTVTNTFDTVGLYAVSLTVSNAAGEADTVIKPDYIRVLGPPHIYVATNGAHVFPFVSWADAATNLEDAVAIAYDGSTVWVSNGHYRITSELTLSGQTLLRSVGGASNTWIDGRQQVRCLRVTGDGAEIDGFTITGGAAPTGGGVYLAADATLRNCVVTSNSATGNGGGIYFDEGGTAINCAISNNTAVIDGAGAFMLRGGRLEHCRVYSNESTTDDGGGVYCDSGGLIRNCVIVDNEAGDSGGGFYGYGGGTLESCTVVSNRAAEGGGTRCRNGGTVVNTIIAYNSAPSAPNHRNVGAFSYTYCNSTPLLPGEGNITDAPAFVDLAEWDLRLASTSACVEAGVNQAWMNAATDLDAQPRIIGSHVDIGAFESPALSCRFAGTPTLGYAPLAVTFTATLSGTNTSPAWLEWDFDGDGSVDASGQDLLMVSNVYTELGAFSVALFASNAVGESVEFQRADYITVASSNVYVSLDGSHQTPFTSWATAATNIHDALAVAVDGHRVTVSNGTYALTTELHVSQAIRLRSLAGPGATILDGQNTARCLRVSHADVVVQGFTLRNGNATTGGGVQLEADATVSNCVISGCHATSRGGGLYAAGTGTVADSVISNNTSAAAGGGGAFLQGGGELRNCLVVGNRTLNSGTDGGGVMCHGDAVVSGCTVSNNVARDDGGGVQCGDNGGVAGGTLRDSVVWGNSCNDKGGGIMLWPGARAVNCVAVSNVANLGGGVYFRGGGDADHLSVMGNRARVAGGGMHSFGSADLQNSIVMSNSAPADANCHTNATDTYAHMCADPLLAGTGNIVADPAWAAPPHDLRLLVGSACIDAGGPAVVSTDMEGTPRPLDGDGDTVAAPDLGAYELLLPQADSDGDGMPDGWEIAHGLNVTTSDGNGDPDHDGATNTAEYVADTDPHDPNSVLRVHEIALTGSASSVSWPSRATRQYHVLYAPEPDGTWTNLHTVPGNGSTLRHDRTNTAPRSFYRIGVSIP